MGIEFLQWLYFRGYAIAGFVVVVSLGRIAGIVEPFFGGKGVLLLLIGVPIIVLFGAISSALERWLLILLLPTDQYVKRYLVVTAMLEGMLVIPSFLCIAQLTRLLDRSWDEIVGIVAILFSGVVAAVWSAMAIGLIGRLIQQRTQL